MKLANKVALVTGGAQGLGQTEAGPHVRPGFQDPPEMADIPLKRLRPQSPLGGGKRRGSLVI